MARSLWTSSRLIPNVLENTELNSYTTNIARIRPVQTPRLVILFGYPTLQVNSTGNVLFQGGNVKLLDSFYQILDDFIENKRPRPIVLATFVMYTALF